MPLPQSKRNRRDEEDASSFDSKNEKDDEAPPKKKPSKSPPKDTVAEGDDLEAAGGTNPTPIFLKKTYKMIDSCDPEICTWSADGLSFIVKDPDAFAANIIPQYFDHNKFSSFARQLNCELHCCVFLAHCCSSANDCCIQSMASGKSKPNLSRTQITTRAPPSMVRHKYNRLTYDINYLQMPSAHEFDCSIV